MWDQEKHQTNEGRVLADFCTINGLEQIVNEPTHIPHAGIETCIDLILTNQPYLFVDKGVIPSPDPLCKHQIVHGKLNFNVPSPPPYTRKVWDYHLVNITTISRNICAVRWED